MSSRSVLIPSSFLSTTSHLLAVYPPLKTLHSHLDVILQGGFPAAGLVEVFGPKASGKTTVLLTAAVSALLEGNQAILIDCCGSVVPSRVAEILHSRGGSDDLLSQISVCRVTSWEILLGCVAHLLPNARFVGIDGIAFLFRSATDSAAVKRLETFAMRLQQKAQACGGIVMFSNDSRILPTGELQTSMGESWRHVCSTRLSLGWQGQARAIEVMKSPLVGREVVVFEIGKAGLVERKMRIS